MAELPQARFIQAPLLVLGVVVSTAILLARYLPPRSLIFILASAMGAGFTLLCIALIAKRCFAPAFVFLTAAFFCAGLMLSLIENRSVAPNRISRMYDQGVIAANNPIELTGIIQGQPEPAPDSFYLTLRAESVRFKGSEQEATGNVLLLAHMREQQAGKEYDALELRHGARIRVMTALDREENFHNPGVLPFTEYLERKGYDATGVIKSPLLIERLDDEPVFLPLAWLYGWRQLLETDFRSRFSPETAGVLEAALLGNRYNVSHDAADRFRAGGTFHVLVIAGLHISFIGGVVFLIVRWLTRKRLLQFMIATTFLWAYAIAVGAHPPVMRAALVFTLVVFAPIVWRRANSLNVIGGAALALLVWRPNDLFDPSFQLTFLSVFAIVTLAAPMLRKLQAVGSWRPTRETPSPPVCATWFRKLSEALFWSEKKWRADMANSNVNYRLFKTPIAAILERWRAQGFLRFAVAAIIVSASVQIGMLPLMIIYFHRISIASPLLNIFVGGLMATLALVAWLAVLISHVSLVLASPLISLAEKINWLMIHFVDPFKRLGIASIRLPHYSGWEAAIYGLYFAPLGFLSFALARWDPLRAVLITKAESKVFSSRHLRIAALAFILVLWVIILHPFSAPRPDGKLHIDFLDVGQGDSALLTMPDGTTLMVDGGGRPNIKRSFADEGFDEPFERDARSIGEGVVSEYLWSRGFDRVDYILPTHADADHINGLNDIARNFRVRGAIVTRTPSDDDEYAKFANTMREADVPIEKIGAGDVLRFGNVTAEVLWPLASADINEPWRNNDSVIFQIRYGDKSLLFTGDIEKEGEVEVLKEGIDLHSNIVKVAHHGSKTSSIDAFVTATRPQLAIISVGRTSMFGHPNKEVVERWRSNGAEVMTTGQLGTIWVVTDGHKLNVSTFVK